MSRAEYAVINGPHSEFDDTVTSELCNQSLHEKILYMHTCTHTIPNTTTNYYYYYYYYYIFLYVFFNTFSFRGNGLNAW